ncbi:MAG: HD domain-containing phosphohydrolase [Anaerolineales bacterium]
MPDMLSMSAPFIKSSLPFVGSPVMIWIIDHEGIFQFIEGDDIANFIKLPDEMVGRSIFKVFADYPDILDNVRIALSGKSSKALINHAEYDWECQFHPIDGVKDNHQSVIGVSFDISLQRQLWYQEALMDTAAALRKARTHEEMPPLIVEQLRQLLQIDQAALVIGDPPEHPYQLIFSWGDWDQVGENNEPITSLLTDPVVIKDLKNNGRFEENYISQNPGSSTIYGSSMTAHDERIGALWVGRQKSLSEIESRLIHGIAEMSASAFNRARHHELTQRHLERIASLHSIDQAISGSFSLNLTLRIILEQVVSQLDVDAANIFLIDDETQQPTFAEGQGFRHYQPQEGISKAQKGLVWQVLLKRELVAIPDLPKEAPTLVRGRMYSAEGFQSYYGIPLIAKGKIQGVLEVFHRKSYRADKEWFEFLNTFGTQAAIAIENAALVENLRRTNLELDQAYQATLEGWVHALYLRDKSSREEHTQRVVERALKLAQAVSIPDKQLVHIRRGALLYDIGKLGVPDEILNKPGPLSEEEWGLMRKHPEYAREMLEPIEFLRPALPIPYGHHEKWDGSGYPEGTMGNQIPIEARVFAVIDVWDALSSARPYRDAWPEKKVNQYIRDQAGVHFDPRVVNTWEWVFRIQD